MEELKQKVDEHDEVLNSHAAILQELRQEQLMLTHRQESHGELIDKLGEDIREIRDMQFKMATKTDIGELRTHIDSSVTGLMKTQMDMVRDTVNAVPQKQANAINTWALVVAVIAGVISFAGLLLLLIDYLTKK